MLKKKSAAKASQGARGGSPLAALLCTVALTLTTATLATWAQAQSGPLEDLAKFPRASLEILHGKSKKD